MNVALRFIGLVFAVLWLNSCVDQHAQPMRFGSNVWPGYEPVYLARELGYLQLQSARLIELTSATQVSQALRNGMLDAAAVTLDEAISLYESGADISILLVMDISNGGDAIVGVPTVTDFRQLVGKKVAIESNALGGYFLTLALDYYDMQEAEITMVTGDVSQHLALFESGQVDAVVSFEPVVSKMKQLGGQSLFDSSQIDGKIVDVLVVNQSYLKQYPTQVQAFIHAWYQALDYLESQPNSAARLIGKRLKLNVDDTLASFQKLVIPTKQQNRDILITNKAITLKKAQELADFMFEKGLLPRALLVNDLFELELKSEMNP